MEGIGESPEPRHVYLVKVFLNLEDETQQNKNSGVSLPSKQS